MSSEGDRKEVLCGAHHEFDKDNPNFKQLVVELTSEINEVVGGNEWKFKKIIGATRQVVAGMLYKIEAEFEHENGTVETRSFKLLDRPWNQPEKRILLN